MSLRDALKAKMTQAEQAAALLDKTSDYDGTKIMGFYVRALGPGGKTYEFQVNAGDPLFDKLSAGFGNLMDKERTAARALLTAMGVQ